MNSSPQYNGLSSLASRERGNADLIIMFSGYSGGGGDGWAGLAWVSSVCATKQNAYNMNLWTNNALITAWVRNSRCPKFPLLWKFEWSRNAFDY